MEKPYNSANFCTKKTLLLCVNSQKFQLQLQKPFKESDITIFLKIIMHIIDKGSSSFVGSFSK
jgi:hypothetical protein